MFQKKTTLQVICIGSISVDLFFPTDEGIIIETPEDITSQKKIAFELGSKVLVPKLYTAVGGVAANVAQGLAKLNVSAASYSCIGRDSNGEFCLNALKVNGVITKYIRVLPEAQTDVSAIIVLTPSGERTIIHNRDANKRLVVAKEDLHTVPWVFISALNGEWQKNIETILHARKDGNTEKFHLAFNPGQHNIKEDSALIFQVIRHTDILILNKDEAIELVLHKHPDCTPSELDQEISLLKVLQNAGAGIVALTDGARGAWVYNGQECWYLATPKNIDVVDVTGAGDAFTSGFLGAHLSGKALDEGLRYGMANSQGVVQEYSCNAGLLNSSEIEKNILHLIPQKIF